jgi:hypothetical protein
MEKLARQQVRVEDWNPAPCPVGGMEEDRPEIRLLL